MAAPARHFPLVTLRASLAAARERGEDFELAWARALGNRSGRRAEVDWPGDTETRIWWREAIEETASAWRSAYELGEPPRGARAITVLASMLDEEPVGAPAPPLSVRDPGFNRSSARTAA